jgi:hypothetical protein
VSQQDLSTAQTGSPPQRAVIEDGDYPDLHIEPDLLESADEIIYYEDDRVYRLEYDPSLDTPTLAVVAAVAAITRTDPMDLDPLHSAIDTSALDDLFAPSPANHGQWGRIVFRFGGFEIMANSQGIIEVDPR